MINDAGLLEYEICGRKAGCREKDHEFPFSRAYSLSDTPNKHYFEYLSACHGVREGVDVRL